MLTPSMNMVHTVCYETYTTFRTRRKFEIKKWAIVCGIFGLQ